MELKFICKTFKESKCQRLTCYLQIPHKQTVFLERGVHYRHTLDKVRCSQSSTGYTCCIPINESKE
jgi:hypothetical protein